MAATWNKNVVSVEAINFDVSVDSTDDRMRTYLKTKRCLDAHIAHELLKVKNGMLIDSEAEQIKTLAKISDERFNVLEKKMLGLEKRLETMIKELET